MNTSLQDAGLLLLRVVPSGIMMTHGWPKFQRLLAQWGSEEGVRFFDFMGLGPEISLVLTVLAELITGRHRVHLRIDDLQPAHLKSIRGGNLFLHGVTEVTATDAKAMQAFNGTLAFPNLEHITPEAYMHLLWGSKETIEQTTIPEWKRKQRRISISFENIAMTTEWVQTILFLETHFWTEILCR